MQACQAGMLHNLAINMQTVILQPRATDHAGGSVLIDAGCKRRKRRQLPPLQDRGGCRTPRLLQYVSHAKQLLYCNEHSNGTNTEHCRKLRGSPAKANRHDYVLTVARRLNAACERSHCRWEGGYAARPSDHSDGTRSLAIPTANPTAKANRRLAASQLECVPMPPAH